MKYYLAVKKEWGTDACDAMDKPLKHYAQQKKPDTTGHMLCGSVSMKCPKEAGPQRQKADVWFPGPVGGNKEWIQVGGKFFLGEMFWNQIIVQFHKFTKNYCIIHFKMKQCYGIYIISPIKPLKKEPREVRGGAGGVD